MKGFVDYVGEMIQRSTRNGRHSLVLCGDDTLYIRSVLNTMHLK